MIGGDGDDTFVQDNVDDYIVAGAGANELISSVNIAQAPDGISKLMLVVKDQSPDSGQPEVADSASVVDIAEGNDIRMELMYAPRAADRFVIGGVTDDTDAPGNSDVYSLNVSPFYDDLDFPGQKMVELSWVAGTYAETGVVGYTVRFRQLTNSDGKAFVDKDGNPDIWHTYVNGTSQDFQGTQANPSLAIRNLADGTYDFEVVAYELAIPALKSRTPDSARHVTLQGGGGDDEIYGWRVPQILPGGLVSDSYTNPLLQNNPIAPLPLGFIFNPDPYNVKADLPDRFATYLDGGFGNDYLNGDYVNDLSGDDYTFQNVVFKGLNTMLGGQGSDTFVVKNGGNAIGDEFDWVVKYGNETPVVTEAGNVGSSLNGGQHNVVYSLVNYLTLSDTLVHQGKFIDQLIVAGGFGMGNRLENYISGSGTLVGNTGRDSISGLGLLIGGTAYGTDDVGFAVRDFAGFIYGGNGLVESPFRDTDPVPTDPNGPGAADPSQFWVVPGNYGPVFDSNRNQDTLIAGLSSTLDGGAGRDSMVGSGDGDMFYVSQGEGGSGSHDIGTQDAVFGNEGNDTVMFTDSDYLWWTGHVQGALLDKNEYSIERGSDSDISNLILQAGSPSARIAIGNDDSKGNPNEGSNMIVGNEFDNVIDGGGVGGNNKNGEGVDWLVGGSGSDNFVVQGYTSSLTNEWSPEIIDYEDGPLAGFSLWFPQRDKSTYTDADYVVIEDFEAGDNLELSASTGSYWIGAAPGNGFALSFNNNVPLLGYLQKPDTTRFGIYTAGTPNLVAIVNLAGGLELDRLSLELAYDPAPSNLVATNSPFRARLGYGTFWKLEGSSFSKYVNQAYTMEDSYASLETLVRSGDDTFTGGVLADNYNGYGANDSLLGGGGNDTLLGESGNDSLFGEAGNDSLLGGKGSDYIDGGFGDDQMIGGTGDDIFVVDALTDAVTEQANEGTDLVIASVSGYALTANANLENLTLAGTAINGSGNALDNRLTGNAENNTLTGLAGNDTLDGGVGTDTLDGGADDDTYIVDTKNDTIEDASGTDTVRASGDFDLSDAKVAGGTGIENLLYTGTTTGVSLVGNINANSITGAAGSDTLDGKDGLNTLVGGSGDDFYVLAVNDDDRIVDTAGTDTALAIGTLSLATLSGGSSIENIQLTAGSGTLTGNALSNTIGGFTGADYLVGGTANDSLSGGGGNDTLVGSSSSARGAREVDTLTGNAGIDIFVLGDSSGVYYDADGNNDYAIITDFGKGTDLLQLNGVAGDYAFGSLTGGYYDLVYTGELIAKVKGFALVTADLPTIANFV
jgi:Ca2+-binding RTX toxin-like protein